MPRRWRNWAIGNLRRSNIARRCGAMISCRAMSQSGCRRHDAARLRRSSGAEAVDFAEAFGGSWRRGLKSLEHDRDRVGGDLAIFGALLVAGDALLQWRV